MSSRVCIPNANAPHPRYHFLKVTVEPGQEWRWQTRCGTDVDSTYGIKSIRRELAGLFARPCVKCFPIKDGKAPR